MPIYEYRCEDCQHLFEEWQKDFVERDLTCPVCGGKARRMISNTAFILKGSGWYVTDYAGKSAADGNGGNGNGNGSKESSAKESGTTDSSSTASTKESKASESSSSST